MGMWDEAGMKHESGKKRPAAMLAFLILIFRHGRIKAIRSSFLFPFSFLITSRLCIPAQILPILIRILVIL